ncbi:hypothetical protein LEMLEM_LOCUS12081 [Lemmus lemmus]
MPTFPTSMGTTTEPPQHPQKDAETVEGTLRKHPRPESSLFVHSVNNYSNKQYKSNFSIGKVVSQPQNRLPLFQRTQRAFLACGRPQPPTSHGHLFLGLLLVRSCYLHLEASLPLSGFCNYGSVIYADLSGSETSFPTHCVYLDRIRFGVKKCIC